MQEKSNVVKVTRGMNPYIIVNITSWPDNFVHQEPKKVTSDVFERVLAAASSLLSASAEHKSKLAGWMAYPSCPHREIMVRETQTLGTIGLNHDYANVCPSKMSPTIAHSEDSRIWSWFNSSRHQSHNRDCYYVEFNPQEACRLVSDNWLCSWSYSHTFLMVA